MKLADAVTKLNALAQDSRLRVFQLLMTAGDQGMSAGCIAEKTHISPTTLSFHLKELQQAELINSQRNGRSIIYQLNTSSYRALLTFLTIDCCAGNPELCQPASIVNLAFNQNKQTKNEH